MAAAHPDLAALIKPFQRVLENRETGAIYRVLSSDAPLQHGLSPSFVVFDEVFVQPDRRLWDALSLPTGAWRQPLIIAITTAGWDRDSLAYQLYEHGRDGDDPTFYFRWFTAPDELAFDDPEAWRAANPALGDFLHFEDFESAIRRTPESEFARFRLNRWTATSSAWRRGAAPDLRRLARHVLHTTAKYEALGPRIQKETRDSPRKIDLAVCAVMALDRARWNAVNGARQLPETQAAWG